MIKTPRRKGDLIKIIALNRILKNLLNGILNLINLS